MGDRFRVRFTELSVFENALPLASGYLHAYAQADPKLTDRCRFDYYYKQVTVPEDELVEELKSFEADLYTFSCYVWNMGLIRRIVRRLEEERPDARIILGGPQVVGHAELYLRPDFRRTAVCNGEGESTFRDYLNAILNDAPLDDVRGLSFYGPDHLITTPPQPLIKDLAEIPSPFLNELFPKDAFTMAVFETNRGCPYQCTFCYWGRGDDLSLRKFSIERLTAELEWISKKKVLLLDIADANWGLLKRDVDLAECIVANARRHGAPMMIAYSAAKNKVERSAKIATMFAEAGIITSQAIGIQSTSDEVLRHVKRKNIKLDLLNEVRKQLEDQGVATFSELIFPLPGETFDSFGDSIDQICRTDVTTVLTYPAVLLHSTPMEKQVDELGIKTMPTPNDVDEIELVVENKWVSRDEYEKGLWMIFAAHFLYNGRALRKVGRYLSENDTCSWKQLFASFGRFVKDESVAVADYWRVMLRERRQSEFAAAGRVLHEMLHEHRADTSDLLARFMKNEPWGEQPEVQVLFELNLLDIPYVYSNTPLVLPGQGSDRLRYFKVEPLKRRKVIVEVAAEVASLVAEVLTGSRSQIRRYELNYQAKQLPHMPARSVEENAAYCYGMLQRGAAMTPIWTPDGAAS